VPAEPAQHYAHLRVAHGLHRRHREGTQMRSGVRTNFYPIASSSFFTHITNNHPTYTLMGFDLTSHNSMYRQTIPSALTGHFFFFFYGLPPLAKARVERLGQHCGPLTISPELSEEAAT
jgi:hypothetical protein